MAAAILIVEGDRQLAERLAGALNRTYDVAIVATGAAALARLAARIPDVIVVGDHLPDQDGLECVETIRTRWPALPVVVTADGGAEAVAVEALQRGATDYVLRHDDYLAHLAIVVRAALDSVTVIGPSPAMAAVIRLVDEAARRRCTVLVQGDSGTGKEHLARAMHARSGCGGRFLAFNCAVAAEDVLEAELERASGLGATVYLGQVSELSPHLQDRLLRLLAAGESDMGGVGGRDLWVIAGSYVPLEAEVTRGALRRDLQAILGRTRIDLPPLRERREDIVPLALHFLARFAPPTGVMLDPAVQHALAHYDWPGNVRELANEIQRDVILAGPGTRIELAHLSPCVGGIAPVDAPSLGKLGDFVDALAARLARDPALHRRFRALRSVTFDPNGREGALSGDRLTASCGSETTFAMVRASHGHSAGRWYVELTLRLPSGASRPGEWTDAGIIMSASRRLAGHGVRRTLGDELADGDVIGLAIDLDGRRLYVRRNGTWVDGAPGDVGGGMVIRHPGRRFVVAVSMSRVAGSSESDAWTANFGAAPSADSLPDGYHPYRRRHVAPR